MLTVSIGSTQVINSMSNYYLIDFDLRDSDSGHYNFEELVEHINRLKTAEITLRMISISVVSVLIVMLYKSLDHFNPIQTDEEPNVENLLTNNDNSIMSFDRQGFRPSTALDRTDQFYTQYMRRLITEMSREERQLLHSSHTQTDRQSYLYTDQSRSRLELQKSGHVTEANISALLDSQDNDSFEEKPLTMLTLMNKMKKISHGPSALNGLQMSMANLVCNKIGHDSNRSIID